MHVGTNNVTTLRKQHVNKIEWSQLDKRHFMVEKKKKNDFNGLLETIQHLKSHREH